MSDYAYKLYRYLDIQTQAVMYFNRCFIGNTIFILKIILSKLYGVTVAPYFLLVSVFFLLAPIATAPHTWLSYGSHAEATRLSCSAYSASFASQITRYLVTHLI
jgi:hypothetical protein